MENSASKMKDDSEEDVSLVLTLRITENTTEEEFKEILHAKTQFNEVLLTFSRSFEIKIFMENIQALFASLAECLTHITFSYPDSEILDLIFQLPNLKQLRIFDIKTRDPLTLSSISHSIEHAFIDEGFNTIDANLLTHMPNLKSIKVQWLLNDNLNKILANRGKIQTIFYMYRTDENIEDYFKTLTSTEELGEAKEIRLVKKSFKRKINGEIEKVSNEIIVQVCQDHKSNSYTNIVLNE